MVGSVAEDPIQQHVATDVGPVLFRELTVEDVAARRLIKTPPPTKQKRPVRMRALALHAVGSQLRFGTGHGAWGGELVEANLETGVWSRSWDDLQTTTPSSSSRGTRRPSSSTTWISAAPRVAQGGRGHGDRRAGRPPFTNEPDAVGVAPGVADLMALGEGRVRIVPPRGRPRVFAGGRVTVLGR
ncbi:hypothetical protein KRR26_22730 [Corallococcus sp. M34]|uniref:hypothetical protein n=1 Tax=Citreicoccus inhibens TaxID=2849499 RepID=UPI001C25064A|nr:hypothetical protein [Citreicoccus inhibens]MBU8898429.1 hypothetical protein [Citreicoccus inhibens]